MIITPLNDELINNIIDLTRQAGFAIMEVYRTDFDIDIKEDKRRFDIPFTVTIVYDFVKDQSY